MASGNLVEAPLSEDALGPKGPAGGSMPASKGRGPWVPTEATRLRGVPAPRGPR